MDPWKLNRCVQRVAALNNVNPRWLLMFSPHSGKKWTITIEDRTNDEGIVCVIDEDMETGCQRALIGLAFVCQRRGWRFLGDSVETI